MYIWFEEILITFPLKRIVYFKTNYVLQKHNLGRKFPSFGVIKLWSFFYIFYSCSSEARLRSSACILKVNNLLEKQLQNEFEQVCITCNLQHCVFVIFFVCWNLKLSQKIKACFNLFKVTNLYCSNLKPKTCTSYFRIGTDLNVNT